VCLKVGKESKRKAAAKAVSDKETPARKKAKSSTSIDQAVKIIKRHIQPAEEDIAEEGLTLDEAVKGDVVPIIPLYYRILYSRSLLPRHMIYSFNTLEKVRYGKY